MGGFETGKDLSEPPGTEIRDHGTAGTEGPEEAPAKQSSSPGSS